MPQGHIHPDPRNGAFCGDSVFAEVLSSAEVTLEQGGPRSRDLQGQGCPCRRQRGTTGRRGHVMVEAGTATRPGARTGGGGPGPWPPPKAVGARPSVWLVGFESTSEVSLGSWDSDEICTRLRPCQLSGRRPGPPRGLEGPGGLGSACGLCQAFPSRHCHIRMGLSCPCPAGHW